MKYIVYIDRLFLLQAVQTLALLLLTGAFLNWRAPSVATSIFRLVLGSGAEALFFLCGIFAAWNRKSAQKASAHSGIAGRIASHFPHPPARTVAAGCRSLLCGRFSARRSGVRCSGADSGKGGGRLRSHADCGVWSSPFLEAGKKETGTDGGDGRTDRG